jgi:hypothetical protein
MKKYIYIAAFVVLGVLVSTLIHAFAEIAIIKLLISDYEKWHFGLTFDTWLTIHAIGAGALLILGLAVGYRQGVYWWGVMYEKSKRPTRGASAQGHVV